MKENKAMRQKGIIYIATISGGKDSTAMCDLLLKNDYPVDYIIFNDTTNEFKEMYEYIEKLKIYFKSRYGKEITVTTPNVNFSNSILRKVKRSATLSRNGQAVGIPVPKGEAMCHLRKTLKINPTESWIRKNIKNQEYKIYIGFTTDEKGRANNSKGNEIYPLIDFFDMSEKDCKHYLSKQEMENPLYKHFIRTGCKLCPYKSETDWWKLYNYFPEDYKEAVEIEKSLEKQKEYKYFLGMKPLAQWANNFKQGSLFDFSDEPLKDCFCKI